MAVINYSDFDAKKISQETSFVLDTNILYYIHSGYYLPNNSQCMAYSNIIQTLLSNGFDVVVSVFSIQELLFGIENKEYLLYCKKNGLDKNKYTKKDFRNNISERQKLQSKLKIIMCEFSLYNISNGNIQKSFLHSFVDEFDVHKMDPIDFIITKNFDPNKTIFVSEDKDFFTNNKITVLTA